RVLLGRCRLLCRRGVWSLALHRLQRHRVEGGSCQRRRQMQGEEAGCAVTHVGDIVVSRANSRPSEVSLEAFAEGMGSEPLRSRGGTSGPGRSAFGPNGGGTAVMGTEQFKAAWVKIAQRLRAELGEDLYSSWFARMEPELATDGQAVVSVPTRFLRSWIQSHYIDVLVRTCAIELPEIEQVQIRVRSPGRPALATVAASDAGEAADTEVRPAANNRRPQQQAADGGRLAIAGSPLDRSLTFETFVVGNSNALAHAAASMVAKAHLLNAIAWRVRETAPERKVLYLSAERFMYHFAAALGAKDMLTFKDFFRSVDLLLIDDFQFLQGRFTQQEFCHTFNSLVDS